VNNTSEDLSNSFFNFLNDYKLIIVAAAVLCLSGAIGYSFYLNSKADKNSEAADLFVQLSSKYAIEEKDEALLDALHEKLETEYGNTGFAKLSLILKARHLRDHQDLKKALEVYYEIIKKTDGIFGDDLFNSMARINVAQIENSLNNFDAALTALQGLSNLNDSLVLEIMGDAQAGLGSNDAATSSYSKALDMEQSEEVKVMLQSKISLLNNSK
jgi:predicted negative regulator of RcsB-dependent stress response